MGNFDLHVVIYNLCCGTYICFACSMGHFILVAMQFLDLGCTLYIDFVSTLVRSLFYYSQWLFVSLSRDSFGPKKKYLFLPFSYSSFQGRSAPIV